MLVLQKVVRNAAFGCLFGILALHQSGRIFKVSIIPYTLYGVFMPFRKLVNGTSKMSPTK